MWSKLNDQILVAAHRGNSAHYPENTLIAFSSAIEAKVDMIELDLHMTKDREIVVIHDHKLDRTTNGSGFIRDYTLSEIKALDAGSWKSEEFSGEKVPAFIEFLELVKGSGELLFNIELKDFPEENNKEWAFYAADKAISLIEEYNIAGRCVLNSWNAELLEYIDEKYEHRYRLHGYHPFFLMGKMKRDPYDYLFCVCLFNAYLDESKKHHFDRDPVADRSAFELAANRRVQPWVYYKEENIDIYRRSVEYGARLFTANDPVKAMEILRGMKKHL